jgi:hypothetical protein
MSIEQIMLESVPEVSKASITGPITILRAGLEELQGFAEDVETKVCNSSSESSAAGESVIDIYLRF